MDPKSYLSFEVEAILQIQGYYEHIIVWGIPSQGVSGIQGLVNTEHTTKEAGLKFSGKSLSCIVGSAVKTQSFDQ